MNPTRALALAILSPALAIASAATAQLVEFVESASELGIVHTWSNSWGSGDLGSGVALEDFDHDGDLDVFVGSKADTPLRVFRNDGTSFTDIGDDLAIATDTDVKQVLFADLDDDGHRDLVLSTWIPNAQRTLWTGGQTRVFRSDGEGRFVEVSGTGDLDLVAVARPTGVAAGDYDRDGDLDLYVSNWVGSENRLLRNDGSFTFAEVGASLGVNDPKKSYQPVFTDLSGDGWPDLVVAEDKRGGMTYYQSNGDGTFTDRTDASGLDGYLVATDAKIDGMGIAVGDGDNDGDLDLYSTNIFDGNVYYRNNGDGTFTESSAATGTRSLRVGWGCGFFDCDNDGWLDLYVTNFGMSGASGKADRLYLNSGAGTFTDIAPQVGADLADDGFGMAIGDLDGNGALDVVVVNGDAPVRVLMAENPVGHWAAFELVGTTSNRDAVGARVELRAGDVTWIREQRAGTSYLSHDSHALEFGLGAHTTIDEVRVRWPSGATDRWTQLAVDRVHVLTEDTGSVAVLPVPQLSVRSTPAGHRVAWTVDPAVAWERFEVLRGAGDEAHRIADLPGQPGQPRYEVVDRGTAETAYRVIAWFQGEPVASAVVETAAARALPLRVASAVPNPFNPQTQLRYRAPTRETVALRIVDSAGRTVRTFEPTLDVDAAGWRTLIWKGLDQRGRPVASGSYRFVVESEGRVRSTALTLVR